MPLKVAFMALVAWMGLSSTASCLSDHEAPTGARIKIPRSEAPITGAPAAEEQEAKHLPPSGGPVSPLEKEIADDCFFVSEQGPVLGRSWSQNVPERDCTDDTECGDGFCDRGRREIHQSRPASLMSRAPSTSYAYVPTASGTSVNPSAAASRREPVSTARRMGARG
jgi:hypothetical protein